jgi:hypothetical protein
MLYISYRGIFDGNDFQDANTPKQLSKALGAGYKCMIDVWRVDGKLYLGNDQPIVEVTEKYILVISGSPICPHLSMLQQVTES